METKLRAACHGPDVKIDNVMQVISSCIFRLLIMCGNSFIEPYFMKNVGKSFFCSEIVSFGRLPSRGTYTVVLLFTAAFWPQV